MTQNPITYCKLFDTRPTISTDIFIKGETTDGLLNTGVAKSQCFLLSFNETENDFICFFRGKLKSLKKKQNKFTF